jgi:3-hydroxyisobutyrate dehydrogenase-like beta-hydroxyacid dehydrogenase
MTTISVLGLGPMGQALSTALLDAGHRMTVWNRTESKADVLRANGAAWAASPAQALSASDLTIINVVDHDVVDALLATAGDAADGRIIVGLTSDTPDRARQTAKLVADLGGRYLDGAIMTPTTTIGTPAASLLFAGPHQTFLTCREVLAALGEPTWLGEDFGRAAAFDLSLLDLFWSAVGGFMHALVMAQANEIAPDELVPHMRGIVDILPPIFDELAERIQADRHNDSTAPVSSVAASVRHLIAASHASGVDAGMLEAFRRHVDAVVAAGQGHDEISRIAGAMTGARSV